MTVMRCRFIFVLLLVMGAVPLAEAIPNPQLVEEDERRRATEISASIVELEIIEVELRQDPSRGESVEVSATGRLRKIVKGPSRLVEGETLRLRYSANYAAAERAWAAYRREAQGGVVGSVPPRTPLRRLARGDVVTAYLGPGEDDEIWVANYFADHRRVPVHTIDLGESVWLGEGSWVAIRLPEDQGTAEVQIAGFGRAACPRSRGDPVRSLCRNVRTQLQLQGMLYSQDLFPGPPHVLQQGYAVELVSSEAERAEIRLIDEESWWARWPRGSEDRFSYGCSGGITGGAYEIEISRDGRVVTSRRNLAGGARTISVLPEASRLATEVFAVLEDADFSAVGDQPPRGSYDCQYDLVLEDTLRGLRVGKHNPSDVNAALREARRQLEQGFKRAAPPRPREKTVPGR